MKKKYIIFSFLLIFNIHIYLKNVQCNDIINYSGLHLRNGLPINSLDLINGLNNRNEGLIDTKIDINENNSSQNNDNNISTLGKHITVIGTDLTQRETTINEADNTHGGNNTVSVANSINTGDSISDVRLTSTQHSTLQGNLNKWPEDNFCNGIQNVPHCPRKDFTGTKGDWVGSLVKQFSNENKGVLVPPRRRQLCLGNFTNKWRRINTEKIFKEEIFKAALGESRSLFNYFNEKNENALTAIKYGFSDIGDIIKGTDLIDYLISKNVNSALDKILREKSGDDIIKKRVDWWEANKADLWNALICGYNVNKGENECPKHDNIDGIPQYLRWFREWGTYICREYQNELDVVIALCNIKKTPNPNDSELEEMSNKSLCKEALKNYGLWINRRTPEWKDQYNKFENDKNKYENIKNLTPENYLKEMCSECNCKNKDLNNIFKEFDNNLQLLKAVIQKKKNQDQLITNSVSPTSPPVSHSSDGNQEVTRTGESEGVSRTTSVVRETSNDITPKQPVQPEVVKGIDALAQKENNNDNILGWEFGPVSVPGTNPYISSEEKNSLELINLTSWDKEDIIKQNEDVQEEKEEEQADEELKREEIEEEQDLLQDEEEHDEFEEEDEQDDLKEEEEQDEEEYKSTKELEQEKKTEDEKKEETIDSSDDKNAHQSLSISYKNNNETKKDAESIVKDLFSLFKEKNTFEDLLKDLTGDLASLFQKQ
ncbi:duffy binding-like merozoite surface protein, putative [Plasmodium sp. gorilla clade G2]|uniref:duffy binding-like merozoite surface protein, putative n=1 Tax=Plasmodium sp. gorilla clade G2 TaxID=880535 RepID=UPI000D2B1042|nr:duffy binding-like merozoite surface protein, putative [Plasmodium sp. gorilla clade G2]SOV20293.1 duffy binding-like merozoite surface protein, putative [Plasmodium sp. gorilla clade G2]